MEFRPVGLESWGIYLPKQKHTSDYISQETGIPKDILEDKFGLKSKSVPGPDDHTVAMGAKASFQALERANITANDLDLIIWAGEVYAERPMMTYGIKLQQLLGNPTKPWAFDINQRCGRTQVSHHLFVLNAISKKLNTNRFKYKKSVSC